MSIKIISLKVHVIQSNLETPFSFSQGWVSKRSATLVEINTNDGITGWGEAFCQGLEPPEISAAVIENALVATHTKGTSICKFPLLFTDIVG